MQYEQTLHQSQWLRISACQYLSSKTASLTGSRDSVLLKSQTTSHKSDSSDIGCLYRPVSNKSYADTHVHANAPTYRKAEHSQDTRARARREQDVNHSPQIHGQPWNACSSYTAEKTRYLRPDFQQGTLTNDMFPFCLAPHSALYLFLHVLQLTTVNHTNRNGRIEVYIGQNCQRIAYQNWRAQKKDKQTTKER
ncbi:hypothetical protein CSKR_113954 [Clonorchis sinensis]|uniref:Uncharacterized protein n=1 Tax=Clonorchis sinensis TaxID=79923 RepID=A0A3R7FV20_CLOSI|nr:hypothetical protein CSKR_113954 [Clonorchis sinensis]